MRLRPTPGLNANGTTMDANTSDNLIDEESAHTNNTPDQAMAGTRGKVAIGVPTLVVGVLAVLLVWFLVTKDENVGQAFMWVFFGIFGLAFVAVVVLGGINFIHDMFFARS